MLPPLLAVVDDDDAFRELLDDLFSQDGYRTLLLAEGAGAPTVIHQAQPDLVLLDLWLEQRRGGWAVLEDLQADPVTRHIPVIVCSADAHGLRQQAERLRERGCAVLEKPFDLDDLLTAVRQAVNHRRSLLIEHEISAAADVAGVE